MFISLIVFVTLVASLIGLIFLQNASSLFVRNIWLVTIWLGIFLYYFEKGFTTNSLVVISFSSVFILFGFLSDYYTATLKSWFFMARVNERTILYGMFVAILFLPVLIGINIVHGLIIGTFFGSIFADIKSYKIRHQSPDRILKNALGAICGYFGKATKVLLAMQVMDIFLIHSLNFKFSGLLF